MSAAIKRLFDSAIEDLAHLAKAHAFFLTEEAQDDLHLVLVELDGPLVYWQRRSLCFARTTKGIAAGFHCGVADLPRRGRHEVLGVSLAGWCCLLLGHIT
jgi:hypothetical protein